MGPLLLHRLTGYPVALLIAMNLCLLNASQWPVQHRNCASHFTLVIPYQLGTMSRSGNPCWGSSGCPL